MPRPRKDTTPRNIAPYARRVKELREDHDMTQQEVADVLNLGQRTYADYELGNIRIPIEMLVSLARYYNVDMNYICGLTTIRRSFPSQSSIRSITPPRNP